MAGDKPEKLLTPREAAVLMGRSHEWVYTQIRRGLLPFQTIQRIGLTLPPAIRLEESMVRALAVKLRRVDRARARQKERRAREKQERTQETKQQE